MNNIEQLEADLWSAADNLRANSKLTSSEYCMPVLGVIFLRHATNRYDDALRQIEADQAAGTMPRRPLVKGDFLKRRALQLPPTPSKARIEFWDGDIPWVSSGELTRLRIRDASLHVTSEAVQAGSRLVPPDTILVVVRGMSLAKEFRMAMTSTPVAFNQDLKALVAHPSVDALYLFHALEIQREQIRERATEASHGTKKLDTPVLAEVPILVPTGRIQKLFCDNVRALHAQWDVLDQQTDKLRAARDLLLPRLMSSEIAA